MKTSILLILVSLSIFFFSCKKEKDKEPEIKVEEQLDHPASDTLAEVNFTSYAHNLSGKALLIKDSTGNKILRFENFNMEMGPDVYVYMSRSSTYSAGNCIQLRKLPDGYTNSSLNIDIDDAIDHSDYKYVIVYCYQYSSLFGNALLN
jgi:ribosomal protein L2